MDFAEKTSVWTFIFLICELQSARCLVQLTHNSTSEQADTFICGTNTKFTCKIDPAPVLMSWIIKTDPQTSCEGENDFCFDDTVGNYQFTSNVSVNEFYLTVNPVMFSNAGTFTCSNGANDDDLKTISIAAVPNDITMTLESGTGTITLQATTDCAFPMSNVSIEWYYLKELTDTPKLYTGFSPVRTENSSTCTSGDCTSGVNVSKVVSTVTFDEKGISGTSAYLQAKMVHFAAPSSSPAVVAITTNKYILFEATPAETYDCPGLGISTAVDSEAKCASALFGIVCCAFLFHLFLTGIVLGCILKVCATSCCVCFYKGEGCEDCNIRGLPSWYQRLWASIIGIPVALGILLVWTSCNNEKAKYKLLHDEDCPENERRKTFRLTGESFNNSNLLDKHHRKGNNETTQNAVGTGSNPKNAGTKLLENKKPSKSPGKPEDVNKEKPASVKQNQHADQAHKVENEGKKPGRPQPLPPVGANPSSQLPNRHSPGHDKKGRGLSANFGDDDHPLVGVDIPAQKAGTLPTLEDTPREDKKKTKKKKKKSEPEDKKEDSKKTETAIDF